MGLYKELELIIRDLTFSSISTLIFEISSIIRLFIILEINLLVKIFDNVDLSNLY